MNALVAAGFVALGGPLGAGERFLLVIDAEDEDSVRTRLAADPWTPMGVLEIESIDEWQVLLDRSSD